jgi:hypothetical protein
LIQHGKTFQYSFSNGRKSIDGPPSAIASMPTFGVPFVLTPYANNKFNSLASILGEKGISHIFFYWPSKRCNGVHRFHTASRLSTLLWNG